MRARPRTPSRSQITAFELNCQVPKIRKQLQAFCAENSSSNSLREFRIVALSKNQALNQDSTLRTSLRNSRRMMVRWENDSKSKIPPRDRGRLNYSTRLGSLQEMTPRTKH